MTDVLSTILKGQPVSLNSNQVMELGARCSSQGYTLQKLIQIAKMLFKSDTDACFKFLEYVERHEISRITYRDFIHQPNKLQIYYSLAALALSKALKESDKHGIQRWQKQFNRYMNEGTKVKTSAQKLNQLLHGFNSYYQGDFSKSINNFNRLDNFDKKQSPMSTIALLGLAQSYFMIRKYDRALEYYKKVLISNRNLPTKARLGMGYCFYQLEKYQLAQKCFQRILSLDPNNFQAYLGLASVSNRRNDIKGYFTNLKKAYQLRPQDPFVLLHISQHFLFKGQYQNCQKASRKGLQLIQTMPKFLKKDMPYRDDYQILKARLNNLIGQVHHINNQFQQAKKYYILAKQRGLKFNDIALAQTYIQSGMFKQAIRIFEQVFSSNKINQIKIVAEFNKTFAYCVAKHPTKLQNQQKDINFYFKQAIKYNRYDYDALVDYSVFLNQNNDKRQTLKTLQNALQAINHEGTQPKPQLLNNLSVCQAEQKHYDQALSTINLALQSLTKSKTKQLMTQQQQVRQQSLYLTLYFNKAIILEINHHYKEAIQIHRSLIECNRFYVDSYVRLADILHKVGQKSNAYALLENGFVQCTKTKIQQIRLDKLISLKSYLQITDGAISQARQTFRRLGLSKSVYDQLFQLSIGYEAIIKKQVQRQILKQFLHSNREMCIPMCNSDHNNVFAFMILVILFLTDNKITKEQGILYFNQLKIAELEFPEIHYNFGVFSLLHEDFQNALSCFNRYRERTKSNKADQYISLAYLLKGDYVQCINIIKKNIISQPNNLKYRFQYAYANEKRIQKLYEQESNFKDLKLGTKYLTICKKIYQTLARISSIQYIKTIQNPQLKQKGRNQIVKIRSSCDDREKFVDHQIKYYSGRQKQIIEKQRKIQQEENKRLQQFRKAKQSQRLLNQCIDDDQSSTEKKARQRRKRLIQQTRQYNQKANQLWKQAVERQEQEKLLQEQQGKKRRRNTQNKRQKKQKRINKQQQQQQYPSEQQFKDDNPSQPNQYESEQEQKRKKKKKKNKNKDRQRQRNKSGESDDNEDKKKKKKRKKQRKDRSDDQDRSQKNQQDQPQSEKGSNPFDDDQGQKSDHNSEQQARKRQEPQKKNPKKDKDDDDNIDINDFIIQ